MFHDNYLQDLGAGDRVFHGQLFPGVYPPDVDAHDRLNHNLELSPETTAQFELWTQRVAAIRAKGATMERLRLLPTTMTDGVDAMIDLAKMVDDPARGEIVRVALFGPQLQRMLVSGVHRSFAAKLQQPVPKAGLWSIRGVLYRDEGPRVVGTMDYVGKVFQGVCVNEHPGISRQLLAYEAFWRNLVYGSTEHSVPLDEWQQLYD